jgi:hypothetical protein
MVKLVPGNLNPGEPVEAEFRNDLTIAAITRAIGPNVMAMNTPKNIRRTMMTIRAPKNPNGSEASGNPYTVPV